jgi:FAD-dependent oxidoreductase domain-containing protein 1
VVGCSAAWHLLTDGFTGTVTIVERDPTYRCASAFLAMGGIRQQFCTPVTVAMMQYSVQIWKQFDRRFAIDGHAPRAAFRQRGYLFLADVVSATAVMRRFELEQRAGAYVKLVAKEDVQRIVPDIVVDDIIYGVLGPEDGYANPREVLAGFRRAAEHAGARFVTAEVSGISVTKGKVDGVRLSNGDTLRAPIVVNAAGPWAGQLAATAGVRVQVEPVRQMLFRATLPRHWPSRFPMVIDPGGVHWRHEDPVDDGDPDRIIVAFTKWNEPAGENFAPDNARWDSEFFPALVRRMPAFRDLHNVQGWAGLYEMTPDHNPVFGEHPELRGLIFANGFSGHGLMMSPATGKIVSEMIRLGRSETFDVGIFAPDRFDRRALVHDAATI